MHTALRGSRLLIVLLMASGCIPGVLETSKGTELGGGDAESPEHEGDLSGPHGRGPDASKDGVGPDASEDKITCVPLSQFFAEEVWGGVIERRCVNCHVTGGAAGASGLVLEGAYVSPDWLKINQERIEAAARADAPDAPERSLLLAKPYGEVAHGGGTILALEAPERGVLERFVARVRGAPQEDCDQVVAPRDFWDGVDPIDDLGLLRRLTLSLTSRLPRPDEEMLVGAGGGAGLRKALDALMEEEAFYERLREAFGDILLTPGVQGNGEETLPYLRTYDEDGNQLKATRVWYEAAEGTEEEAQFLAHADVGDNNLKSIYRASIKRAPVELIVHVVRAGQPYTEILTADYQMMSPLIAKGYGLEPAEMGFEDAYAPYEYIPVRWTDHFTGEPYAHAGLLSETIFLWRYPSTATNRNRLRARVFFQLFLGIDVMTFAPPQTDPVAAAASDNPTVEVAQCNVCHKLIDPIAGLYQNHDKDGHRRQPSKIGPWYPEQFPAGFGDELLPESERARALPWLAARTAADPRFARAAVLHAYYILFGRAPLTAPELVGEADFAAKRRAFDEQERVLREVSAAFEASQYDFKVALRELALSPLYRADNWDESARGEAPAELEELGLQRLLSPEMLHRKIEAIFGESWTEDSTRVLLSTQRYFELYGGIDRQETTERLDTPSGVMGGIQRLMANLVPCQQAARDFERPAAARRLFPYVEPGDLPGADPETDARIRQNLVFLHQRLLGPRLAPDDEEIERSFALLRDVQQDGAHAIAQGMGADQGYGPALEGECASSAIKEDPTFVVRAWRAVLSYQLLQYEFLYE